ncbi:uncharacterized protein [Elaeis guineensis]|uniref:uncharacterized protein isoform X2 n=1 Tax=Elaeis guineensis var. tenera TaxID=51953 RepID=UPI003C6D8FE7
MHHSCQEGTWLREAELKCDVSAEEIRSIMEVIAATGKFWHDWDMLKSLLSFRLKQVLAEYPEAQMVSGVESQQSSLSGETYPELVKRLDEVKWKRCYYEGKKEKWSKGHRWLEKPLLSFVEGPPFTLQRLCEILLNPKGTYTNLSKLALALEKNLLVTSTLTMCTDPYPTEVVQKPDEPDKASEVPSGQTDPVPNGVETVAGDGDEEMTDAEADENTTNTDAEMQEEKVTETSDGDSDIRSDANPSQELCTSSEQQNP